MTSSSQDTTITTTLSQKAWPVRMYAWVQERFPLAQGVLILTMYLASALAGRAMTTPAGEALALRPFDVLGFLGLWGFFLMLRVFDEHKDYDKDLHNHPDRVLQRGVITLGDHDQFVNFTVILEGD